MASASELALFKPLKHTLTALVLFLAAGCVSSPARYTVVNGLDGRMISVHDYFPASLRRRGVSDLVLLNYSVSAAGVPQRIEVMKAGEPAFAREAVEFLSDWRFKVPANWAASGGTRRRYSARVKFAVTPVVPVVKWDPNNPLFVITGFYR